MPHWNGYVDAETPPHLADVFGGTPSEVEAAIREDADRRADAQVLAVSWELGKWNRRAHVSVAGADGLAVLEHFAAKNIRKLRTSEEKDKESDSGATSETEY
jgi:hypothetical protein